MDTDSRDSYLGCRDTNDQVRFTWGESKAQKTKRKIAEAKTKEEAA